MCIVLKIATQAAFTCASNAQLLISREKTGIFLVDVYDSKHTHILGCPIHL